MQEFLTIKQASEFASRHLNKNVTASNIAYLINYGRIEKSERGGAVLIEKQELINYYAAYYGKRETDWKQVLGDDLNWHLSFETLKETDTTKHVHRLHPYKGKFIPQLVGYFLDARTDKFKREVFFQKGDIVLDPFCGSGTTLVQANELGIHAVGVDVSIFNALISNVKVRDVDFYELNREVKRITKALQRFVADLNHVRFETTLVEELNRFNNKFFPSPEFKIKVIKKEINEKEFAAEKEKEFLPTFEQLVKQHGVRIKQNRNEKFLEKWFLQPVRDEIGFVFGYIEGLENGRTKDILKVILSRTIRSCRATTHADLATLVEPVAQTYYCAKHGKICKPLFSILSWWERYAKDTIKRLGEFQSLRTNTFQVCLTGNSQEIDLLENLKKENSKLAALVEKQKIKGIFSSPPYVGLIDYHEQHAYAYDLFEFERKDELEIGAMQKGASRNAKEEYIKGIVNVLLNSKKYLVDDYDVFLVANDKSDLYSTIAYKAGMKIVNQYKRPVLNRTEKDKGAYSEIIFHLKDR